MSEVYFVVGKLRDYGVELSKEQIKDISAAAAGNKPTTSQPGRINVVAESLASGDINKFAKGGAL
jgi:hypothetical protein